MPRITEFQKMVYAACRKIPCGKVRTYQDLANMIGRPRAARAVGNALHANPFAPNVPCHRVIRSDGRVGGFGGGAAKKIRLLRREGVKIKIKKGKGGVVYA